MLTRIVPPRATIVWLVGLIQCGLLWLSSTLVATASPPHASSGLNDLDHPPLQKGTQPKGSIGVYRDRVVPHWFADDTKFWYRNDLKDGQREFILVDAEKGTRTPAFDNTRLAAALSKAAGGTFRAERLPFLEIQFSNDCSELQFEAANKRWQCNLVTYECRELGPASKKEPIEQSAVDEPKQSDWPDSPWVDDAREIPISAQQPKKDPNLARSPDGKWIAEIRDFNIYLRDGDNQVTQLTKDGKEGYAYGRLTWAPDSKALVAFRIEQGDRKPVYLIESSPRGGGRAIMTSRPYDLPGDRLTCYELHVFNVETKTDLPIDDRRIEPATGYEVIRIRWNPDGHTFTYQRTQRGHQRWRLVEVDTHTGKSRNLIDEKTETFIWTAHAEAIDMPLVTWLQKSRELIYVSEKSGWRHLYLIDATTGKEKNPITQGQFVVRGIDRIDEDSRTIWFRASGMNPDQDPYFIHYYRCQLDGSGLVALTQGNGTHTISYSPNRKYLIDTYSRVDLPPVTELRRERDGQLIVKLEEADISELKNRGWTPLEVFKAKGRDGHTDIWGVIARPRDFDPHKKYPVIESIYAGPQGSFVPKAFSAVNRYSSLANLGFIVVQIDGMGTANRSKAFHDVCWKNLKDAGFPDRILWHQAVAAKYPYYDISRVGIYGTSAGGQNALGALLFHGHFYKAAVAACGCHDNRMDKASWNEQWMGYPVGPQYAASSNVEHAKNLTGKLLLIVGELDTNVPPESTMRVVDALIKANKDFELLVVPGMGHSNGGSYGTRRMQDFFLRHLQGVNPPDRNNPQK
jgi:dipeptidyl aminopeptidase/acylaminoacyl peptidase